MPWQYMLDRRQILAGGTLASRGTPTVRLLLSARPEAPRYDPL